ncbi:MAG: glucoamylase family protein [Bacteroidales bacterium]|nr:glucoamylase family protein [Bacteroidales bacterium]MDD3666060.1 glucoamylase family protein [Bacteroidales bacterium]
MTKPKGLFVLLMLLMWALAPESKGQVWLYFQDSPTNDYYDASWMELTPPSELERMGSELRKFPVETTVVPQQGENCLRLRWTSKEGGSWVAIAAGDGWAAKDLTDTDTCMFYLQAAQALNRNLLPKVFMEDVLNVKTTFHDFSPWVSDLPQGSWIRVTIPMSVFLNAGDPVDFTRIKTIGFAQNSADGVEHTLYVDNMRVFKGTGITPQASAPTGVRAKGYDSHSEIRWYRNPETWVTGYQIERSFNGGSFSIAGSSAATDTLFIDFTGTAKGVYTYRVKALNTANEPSEPSVSTAATTLDFSDEQMLDMVQEYTFRYFWDFAHPASGMARERNTSGDVVTTGGSGFGLMAILTGIHRGFITRQQGVERLTQIVGFLESADRFHGVWPHWLNGQTGAVVPFSTYDNGGDLVETAFMIQGLLTVRQFLDVENPTELNLKNRITALWEGVEWDWYRRNTQNLYWHWSPTYGWQINMTVKGWNEAAIVYILGIASPTHSVPASTWAQGWAGASYYRNGRTFYGYKLDVGWDYGGPLFFAHYSFLGFDPRGKKDAYANYFVNNRNHSLINRAYCIANPKNYQGYGASIWGLTASDDPDGYAVHEPTSARDNGTITPSAALSSMPYTPNESMAALRGIYQLVGDKNWGPMGFHDAFNQSRNWYTDSYLAIDQGPIVAMIENYRSGLLWDLFMSNPEIEPALQAVGFVPDASSSDPLADKHPFITLSPNPASERVVITSHENLFPIAGVEVLNMEGRKVKATQWVGSALNKSQYSLVVDLSNLSAGIYLLRVISNQNEVVIKKLVINN